MSVLYKKETYQIISCSQALTQEKSLEMTAFSEWKLKSSPTDELRVTTIRHHHTDRVSGDTYHTVFHSHQQKRGRWDRRSTLQVQMALETNRTFSHSWQAKHVSPTKPRMRPEHDRTEGIVEQSIQGNPESCNHPRTLRPTRCLEGRRAPRTGDGGWRGTDWFPSTFPQLSQKTNTRR